MLQAPAGGTLLTPLYSQLGPRFCCVYQRYTRMKGACQQSGPLRPPKKSAQNRKTRKAQLSRAKCWSAVRRKAHPSGYSVEPGLAYREEAVGAAPGDQVTFLLPSLGAKYRGLWKTCQEENGTRPQNLRLRVSKSSTGSGVTAGLPLQLDRANMCRSKHTAELTRAQRVKKNQ